MTGCENQGNPYKWRFSWQNHLINYHDWLYTGGRERHQWTSLCLKHRIEPEVKVTWDGYPLTIPKNCWPNWDSGGLFWDYKQKQINLSATTMRFFNLNLCWWVSPFWGWFLCQEIDGKIIMTPREVAWIPESSPHLNFQTIHFYVAKTMPAAPFPTKISICSSVLWLNPIAPDRRLVSWFPLGESVLGESLEHA